MEEKTSTSEINRESLLAQARVLADLAKSLNIPYASDHQKVDFLTAVYQNELIQEQNDILQAILEHLRQVVPVFLPSEHGHF